MLGKRDLLASGRVHTTLRFGFELTSIPFHESIVTLGFGLALASISFYVSFIVCDVAFEYSGDITIPPC